MSVLTKEKSAEQSSRFDRITLLNAYQRVRNFSHYLTDCLETEDFVVQPMENASPTKWHLAHTSWFFETFVLVKFQPGFSSLHPQYAYLFNSYYLQTGVPFSRSMRGVITRPTVKEVFEYRSYVDDQMQHFIQNSPDEVWNEAAEVVEIGLNHEQQHQELILTDIKYTLAQNPLLPVYRNTERLHSSDPGNMEWVTSEEQISHIGHPGNAFTYDNEHPRHKALIQKHEFSNRLVTNSEFLSFMEDGGYSRSELWLDEGWSCVHKEQWNAPLYWFKREDEWWNFTLGGARKVDPNEPVCHVSFFEADAYARWKDARLPTEQEWEFNCGDQNIAGNFVEKKHFHPVALDEQKSSELQQMYGDVWEWTLSSYSPYPGYKPLAGALGEYNGKFMSNQYVLRGGSCATSQSHIRKTYRNFFQANARWQFSGIRLAR
jgi:ergothioneine biosynthesis protein EgtB